MAKPKIIWPENINVQGQLSFPLTSKADLDAVAEWRVEKGIKKPKFDDTISVTLLLTHTQVEKVAKTLEEIYLPFVDTLYKDTDGDKGIEPAATKELMKLVKARDWSQKNLPIRELSAKDLESLPDDTKYVAKIKIMGPYQSDFKKKAIVLDSDGNQQVVTLDELIDDDILPEGAHDSNKLWWGSGWKFRVSIRFNAFDTAKVGVSAYGSVLYLLPHLGLETGGYSPDATIIDDGDDWTDED